MKRLDAMIQSASQNPLWHGHTDTEMMEAKEIQISRTIVTLAYHFTLHVLLNLDTSHAAFFASRRPRIYAPCEEFSSQN